MLKNGSNAVEIFGFIPLFAVFIRFCSYVKTKEKREISSVFDRSFVGFQGNKPELNQGHSYSFPAFEITFESRDDVKAAESGGNLKAFKTEMAALYDGLDGKQNPFNVEGATWVTVRK